MTFISDVIEDDVDMSGGSEKPQHGKGNIIYKTDDLYIPLGQNVALANFLRGKLARMVEVDIPNIEDVPATRDDLGSASLITPQETQFKRRLGYNLAWRNRRGEMEPDETIITAQVVKESRASFMATYILSNMDEIDRELRDSSVEETVVVAELPAENHRLLDILRRERDTAREFQFLIEGRRAHHQLRQLEQELWENTRALMAIAAKPQLTRGDKIVRQELQRKHRRLSSSEWTFWRS